jgi:hypothetical protein
MDLIKPRRHKRKTAKVGKNALQRNMFINRKIFVLGSKPVNAYGCRKIRKPIT